MPHTYRNFFLPRAPPINPRGPSRNPPNAAFPTLKPFLCSSMHRHITLSPHAGHFVGADIIYSFHLCKFSFNVFCSNFHLPLCNNSSTLHIRRYVRMLLCRKNRIYRHYDLPVHRKKPSQKYMLSLLMQLKISSSFSLLLFLLQKYNRILHKKQYPYLYFTFLLGHVTLSFRFFVIPALFRAIRFPVITHFRNFRFGNRMYHRMNIYIFVLLSAINLFVFNRK